MPDPAVGTRSPVPIAVACAAALIALVGLMDPRLLALMLAGAFLFAMARGT